MREILFKGKRIDNGEWVTGFYFQRVDTLGKIIESIIIEDAYRQVNYGQWHLHSNIGHECYWVDPETVGQSLEMHDRHKVLAFENDIVEFIGGASTHRYLIWWNRECSMMTAVPLDGIYFNGHDYGNMEYPNFNYSTFCLMMQDPWGDFRDIKVIGNIHDNPELLEGVTQYG